MQDSKAGGLVRLVFAFRGVEGLQPPDVNKNVFLEWKLGTVNHRTRQGRTTRALVPSTTLAVSWSYTTTLELSLAGKGDVEMTVLVKEVLSQLRVISL